MNSSRDTQKFIIFVLVLVLLITVAIQFRPSDLGVDTVRGWIDQLGPWGGIAFAIIYAVAISLLLPGAIFTAIGGALFGWVGIIYVVCGATLGAMVSFGLARWLGEPFVRKILKNKFDRLATWNDKLEDHGFMTVLFLRLVPLFPFNGLNVGLGLTKVTAPQYFLATLLGIIPGTVAYGYFGIALADLNVVEIVIAIGLIALLSAIYPGYLRGRRRVDPPASADSSAAQ
jgi:uncharacterized membrane protein YdjX (TVP38/TMEM64 family)